MKTNLGYVNFLFHLFYYVDFHYTKRGDFIMGILNLVSLVLGIISWLLPISMLDKNDNKNINKQYILSMISLSCCIVSLFMQTIYNNYLVNIYDWSALLDTTPSLVIVEAILIFVTIILNILCIMKLSIRMDKNKEVK